MIQLVSVQILLDSIKRFKTTTSCFLSWESLKGSVHQNMFSLSVPSVLSYCADHRTGFQTQYMVKSLWTAQIVEHLTPNRNIMAHS